MISECAGEEPAPSRLQAPAPDDPPRSARHPNYLVARRCTTHWHAAPDIWPEADIRSSPGLAEWVMM
jgi:hypothetical protein